MGIVGRYAANGLLGKTFVNPKFRDFSKRYWDMKGGAYDKWYGFGHLDHVFVSSATIKAGRFPASLGNAGWNLLEIPGPLNQVMGMRNWAPEGIQLALRVTVTASVPVTAATGAYGGYEVGKRAVATEAECECSE
ncbi:hypothetical protein LP419_29435 [Massilia sp. H-1]|nr:hypothetical protein LP419_29435 [Massilia sp. H-1]